MTSADGFHSILEAHGRFASSCGYCTAPGSGDRSEDQSSWKVSATALQLSARLYQHMMDRGWRRSGTYCYKPDLKASCCPQYAIRLDAVQFQPSKSQRKLISRWNRYIELGDRDDQQEKMDEDTKASKGKKKADPPIAYPDSVHASEKGFRTSESNFAHDFEVTLESSSYSEEKYKLFEAYQRTVHNDSSSPGGFRRFLVDSPIPRTPIPYPSGSEKPRHLPTHYGSYHQLYRVDGKLIAVGVLDILPFGVSSVYFIYDAAWEKFSPGKLSAFRETSLALELHRAGLNDLRWLYLGLYVHTCQKMKYKGTYSPSQLLDPETYEWYPFPDCAKQLDQYHYACFSKPEHSLKTVEIGDDGERELPQVELEGARLIEHMSRSSIRVAAPELYSRWNEPSTRRDATLTLDALGPSLSKEILILCE